MLAIDIGNTNIVAGVFRGDELVRHWRVATRRQATADEYGLLLKGLFADAGLSKKDLSHAAVSCVVPGLGEVFSEALVSAFGISSLVVGPGVKTGMPILTDDPREVGADRIVNAVAAYRIYGDALIVVDFGTAVTFDCVTAEGEYVGGAIAPGMTVAANALFERAARLHGVEIARPRSAIGKSTAEGLKSGVFYGYAGLVDGLVNRLRHEMGRPDAVVVATGGEARLMAGACGSIGHTDEFLTLKGLKFIYEANT